MSRELTAVSPAEAGSRRLGPKPPARGGLGFRDLLWLALVGVAGYVGVQDVGTNNQLLLALAGMSILLVIQLFGLGQALRGVFILIAAFLTVRYLGWRIVSTLPPADTLGFVPAVLLFMAELYGIGMYFFGVFVNIQPIDRETAPLPSELELLPTVDVLIPSYNENRELLERTIMAAQGMEYPAGKLRVHLLDDGGTDQKRRDRDPTKARAAQERREQLKSLCEELGAVYLTRARNEHAKAGNINAALRRTHGELVLVLDADHVPTRDLLVMTVGHFLRDPKLFLVQTPHFFINPDPIERNLGTFDRMPSENEMFYCIGQRGLDFWNGSFFCGSAALLRRACLDEVGGIQGATITEDAETALELHARGFNSVYVARPMIAGLQPETFSGFIGQRTRWAQGMLQILILKSPIFKRGLTLPQRLCYLSSNVYWLFPIARLLFMLTPLAYLVFGLQIYEASFDEFVAYGVAHLMASLMLSNLLFGHVRWPFISELYEIAQAPFIAPALLGVILRPRSPTFQVTAKAETLDRRFVSHLARPLAMLLGILTLALAVGLWRWQAYPLERESLAIVLGWNILNMLFVAAALGVTYEQRQVRGDPRIRRALPGLLELGEHRLPATILDLSSSGVRLHLADDADLPADLGARAALLHIQADEDSLPVILPIVIRHTTLEQDQLLLGCRFQPRDIADKRAIVQLCFGSSEVWQEFQTSRHGKRTVVSGLLYLCSLAVLRGGTALFQILTDRGAAPAGRPSRPAPTALNIRSR